MRKLFVLGLAICLFASLGLANDGVYVKPNFAKAMPTVDSRGLGDALWALNVEAITGDNLCLGCEFDGTNYWVTGAGLFTNPHISEITPGGTLVNSFAQPAQNIGYWGFRDLAWDGQYLYAGADSFNASKITQLNPADGQPTGVAYGPFGVNPCRALAYDSVEDVFWTASFGSNLYKCRKDNTQQSYTNPGALAMYGAAAEETGSTKIWWWSQDGNGCLATQLDTSAIPTGKVFDGDTSYYAGGIAGGAGAYPVGSNWELVGLAQGSPDHIVGYDLAVGPGAPLEVTPAEVSAWLGGTFNFYLNGGVDNAGRKYLLLGSASGTVPGTPLPGGQVLGINFDWFSDLLLSFALGGGYGIVNDFIGNLDVDGLAEASLVFPGHCQLFEDLDLFFAWCTVAPFDFVSNSVQVKLLGAPQPPEGYFYDDGSSEDALAWTAGGDQVWVHSFDSGVGDTIDEVSTTFGINGTTYGAPNGTPCETYVWDDPNGDRNPSDAVLLSTVAGVVANTNTNTFNHYVLGAPVAVNGWFFVGAWVNTASGYYTASMDTSGSPYTNGDSWFCGAYTGSGLVWDPNDFNAGIVYELSAIGFPYQWLLRANDP